MKNTGGLQGPVGMRRTCPGFCLHFQVPTIKQRSRQACFPSSSLNSSVCLHLYLQTAAQGQLCFHFIRGGGESCRNQSRSPSSGMRDGKQLSGESPDAPQEPRLNKPSAGPTGDRKPPRQLGKGVETWPKACHRGGLHTSQASFL